MITLTFVVRKDEPDLVDGYSKLRAFLASLEPVYPVNEWYRLPVSLEEGTGPWTPVADADVYLRQIARDMGEEAEKWPGEKSAFDVLVTTAVDAANYGENGRVLMTFAPSDGLVAINMIEPDASDAEIYDHVRGVFLAACRHLDLIFACCDFARSPRPDGSAGETSYGVDLRVFPHREFFGWMGFVKEMVLPDQVPEADELVPIRENGGTVIIAVAHAFDVHNAMHIEKAQRVEMRLVDLDVLPVTDPRFLD